MVTRLRGNGAISAELAEAGRIKIVGARYDLDNGEVDFFTEG